MPTLSKLVLDSETSCESGFLNLKETYSPPTAVSSVLTTRSWSIHVKRISASQTVWRTAHNNDLNATEWDIGLNINDAN